MNESEVGTLPAFLMIGAQECGTESLYWTLARHPNVSPAVRKEVHFFDRYYSRGLSWYRKQFSPPAAGMITGEASPYYLFHPHVPKRVKATLPDARFIVVLRNPVERALYQFEHNRNKGHISVSSFESALDQEAEEFAAAHQRLLEQPLLNDPIHRHYSYLVRGRYIDQILRWQQYFAPDRFLILETETLFSDPARAIFEVTEFLGLPTPASELVFEDLDTRYHDIMDERLRRRLHEHFRPFNERLFEHIGCSYDWD